jgi:hypothetical protein
MIKILVVLSLSLTSTTKSFIKNVQFKHHQLHLFSTFSGLNVINSINTEKTKNIFSFTQKSQLINNKKKLSSSINANFKKIKNSFLSKFLIGFSVFNVVNTFQAKRSFASVGLSSGTPIKSSLTPIQGYNELYSDFTIMLIMLTLCLFTI